MTTTDTCAPTAAPVELGGGTRRGGLRALPGLRAVPALPDRGVAVLMVLGSCSSFQVGAAFATHLFPATGSSGATLLRIGFAACLMLALARPNVRAWSKAQWRAAALLGLSLGGTNGFFYAAIARIPLGVAVTVQFVGPLTLAAILSRRLRDLGWVLVAGLGVALLGLAGHGTSTASGAGLDPAGIVLALLAGVGWALYILAGAHAGKVVPGRGGLAVALGVGTLALLPFGAQGAAHLTTRPGLVLVAMGAALMGSIVPYTLELSALRRIPRRAFGVLLSVEPGIAALAGWLLLSQHIGAVSLIAIAVVVLASAGSTVTAKDES